MFKFHSALHTSILFCSTSYNIKLHALSNKTLVEDKKIGFMITGPVQWNSLRDHLKRFKLAANSHTISTECNIRVLGAWPSQISELGHAAAQGFLSPREWIWCKGPVATRYPRSQSDCQTVSDRYVSLPPIHCKFGFGLLKCWGTQGY